MAGDILHTILLVGMGFRKLSMAPNAIPDVKKLIRSIPTRTRGAWPRRRSPWRRAAEIETLLESETRKVIPELLDEDEATA